jgi:hypothetical protein
MSRVLPSTRRILLYKENHGPVTLHHDDEALIDGNEDAMYVDDDRVQSVMHDNDDDDDDDDDDVHGS